jgi:hypothetical protein
VVRPAERTTPHANSTGSSSNVAGSSWLNLCTTGRSDSAPHGPLGGARKLYGGSSHRISSACCGVYLRAA